LGERASPYSTGCRVCEGTSCFVATLGRHIGRFEAALGVGRDDCAADGSVSLQVVHCLGFCYASPAALDGQVPRTGPTLGGLLEPTDVRNATGRGAWSQPPSPSDSAPPVPYLNASPHAVLLAGLLGEEGSWQVWPEALAAGSAERVFAEVRESDLRGRGGAEFPVTVKWAAAARGPAPRHVVVNGDEGDPGSFCDRLLMEHDPHRGWKVLGWPASRSGRCAASSW
jgi:NADH-quinone oxidoreductase subunit F